MNKTLARTTLGIMLTAGLAFAIPSVSLADRDDGDRGRKHDKRDKHHGKKWKKKHKHKHVHLDQGHGRLKHNHVHRPGHHPDDDHHHVDHGHDNHDSSPQVVTKPVPSSGGWQTVNVGSKRFSSTDRSAIKRYYRKTSRMLKLMAPPAPPPGTEKMVRRGVRVPPLIPIKSLPSSLKRKLGAPKPGYKYGSIGAAVILYKKSSRAVSDVYQVKPL